MIRLKPVATPRDAAAGAGPAEGVAAGAAEAVAAGVPGAVDGALAVAPVVAGAVPVVDAALAAVAMWLKPSTTSAQSWWTSSPI
jgi:hypothetical protein